MDDLVLVSRLLAAFRLDPSVAAVALGLAVAALALVLFVLDRLPLRKRRAIAAVALGGAMVVALGLHAQKRQPGVVILCESGGVYRSFNASGGFIASGGPCVLHDEHGGRTTAEGITVYDNAQSTP